MLRLLIHQVEAIIDHDDVIEAGGHRPGEESDAGADNRRVT